MTPGPAAPTGADSANSLGISTPPAPRELGPHRRDRSSQPSLARNIVSSWAVLGANILYSFLITPVVVRALQPEAYGFWTFLNSLIGYSDLLYFGLGAALVKYVAKTLADRDTAGLSRLLSVILTIYTALGCVSLLACWGLSFFVGSLFGSTLSPGVRSVAAAVCLLMGVRMLIAFVSSAFSGFIQGHDRFDLVNKINLIVVMARIVSIPWSVSGSQPLLTLAVVTTLLSVFQFVAVALLAFRVSPALQIRWTRPTRQELRMLYGFGFQSFLVLSSIKLIAYTDTTVIGIVLGATQVALYVLPLQLIEYCNLVVSGFSAVLLPRLAAIAARLDDEGMRTAFIRCTRFGLFLGVFLMSPAVSLGARFIDLWVGATYALPAAALLPLLGISALCRMLSVQLPFSFFQALGTFRVPAIVLVFEGIVNVLLSVALASRFGIVGVALGTLVPCVFISSVTLPTYVCRRLGISGKIYLRDGLLPAIVMLALSTAHLQLLNLLHSGDTLLWLALKTLSTIPIALVVFLTLFPSDDKAVAFQFFRRRLRASPRGAGVP